MRPPSFQLTFSQLFSFPDDNERTVSLNDPKLGVQGDPRNIKVMIFIEVDS